MRKNISIHFFLVGFVLCLIADSAFAQFDWLREKLNIFKKTPLSDTEIGAGLKEALKVSIENTIKTTGKTDGYFRNETIKILMPEKLKILDKTLRMMGYGEKLDEFVLSMNRAAEKAAPEAEGMFLDAIFDITFEDARKILNGGDTAATDFFREKTYDKLAKKYQPVIEKVLNEHEVTRKYQEIIGSFKSVPFADKLMPLDLNQYVIDEALNGLFYVLGTEERKIRKDPSARVTDLLQKIFKETKKN